MIRFLVRMLVFVINTVYRDRPYRRFCFRFSSQQIGTRGNHRRIGKGSMGRVEQIVAQG